MNWIWDALGIAPTGDTRTIRRAYADRRRTLDVDADPGAFTELRNAREAALAYAGQSVHREPEHAGTSDHTRLTDSQPEVDHGIWSEPEAEPEPEPEPLPQDAITIPLSVLDPPHIEGEGDAALSVTPPAAPADPVATAGPDVRPASVPVWNAPRPPAHPWAATIEGLGGHGDVVVGAAGGETDRHFEAILALFFSGQDDQLPDLDAGQVEQLRGHVEALLASPRMEEIDFHADTERWMSEVIARACPESDPIVRRVADYFGWTARADEIGLTPAIDFVVRRARSLDFVDAVQQRRHPMFAAWRELSRPANETSRRGRVPAREIANLLALIRRDHPALEALFDPYRVSLWEPAQGRPLAADRINAWWVVVPLFLLLRFCASYAGDDHRPAPRAPVIPVTAPDGSTIPHPPLVSGTLNAPTVDIDRALEMLYGDELDVARLETGNPALYALVLKAWEDAHNRGQTAVELRRAIEALMWKSYRAGIKRGGYDLVADDARLTLDRARALRTAGPEKCVAFFNGESVDEAPGIDERQRALVVRTVLETGAVPGKDRGRGKFGVAPDVIDRASANAGISREDFLRGINFEGSATNQCDARIALMETALDLPASRGLKLLRDLS